MHHINEDAEKWFTDTIYRITTMFNLGETMDFLPFTCINGDRFGCFYNTKGRFTAIFLSNFSCFFPRIICLLNSWIYFIKYLFFKSPEII